MKIKLKNVYLLRFVVLALLFMALGWLLAYPFFEELEIVYVGVVVLVAIMLIRYLLKLASFVPNQVNYFLHSLLCHDYMIHFPATKDTKLGMMYENMNRIIAQYRNSLLDIEYKQQYYNRLLRIMTHELRNSITPVITLSSDMLKRPENYAACGGCFPVIMESGEIFARVLVSGMAHEEDHQIIADAMSIQLGKEAPSIIKE